jgi:SAM-dependent methyltransferase
MWNDKERSRLIDAAMRQHPNVRESLTLVRELADGGKKSITFLVPEMHLATQAGYELDLVKDWRRLWDLTYSSAGPQPRGDLNLKGWSSSYTRQQMPENEMLQWIQAAVAAISATGSRTFCEIGCGTGLLISRLAPGSERYLGVDMAKTAVEWVAREVGRRNLAGQVELAVGTADNIAAIAGERRFDCVILNSVAQYFPDEEYLTRALLAAASVVEPGGFVFIGDVRHLGLANAFYASVLQEQGMPAIDLRLHVRARAAEEKELLIDPGYFTKLRGLAPSITGVQISLKPSGLENELTRFRYDVLLQVSGPSPPSMPGVSFDWDRDIGSMERLRPVLSAATEEFIVEGIPNARVAPFFSLLAESPVSQQSCGVSTQELSSAATAHSWQVHLEWSTTHNEGRIRALFHRRGRDIGRPHLLVDSLPLVAEPVVSSPRYAALLRTLPQAVRSWARGRLPAPLAPGIIRAVPALPLAPSGEVDRDALAAMADPMPGVPPARQR